MMSVTIVVIACAVAACGGPTHEPPGPTVTVTATVEEPGTPVAGSAGSAGSAATPASSAARPVPVPAPTTAVPALGTGLGPARVYVNARFGYRVAIPGGLTASGESDNGDGMGFRRGQIRATAYGFNVGPVTAPTPASIRAEWIAAGATVTYEGGNARAFSTSGTQGSTVFYVRYLCGVGSCAVLQWTYPMADKALVDAAVTESVKSFVPGDLSVPH